MKKLLVLMLVLVLASSASAALTDIELQLSGTTLTIVGKNAVSLSYGLYNLGGAGAGGPTDVSGPGVILADGTGGDAGGALASINVYQNVATNYSGFDFITLDSSPATDAIDAMDWFTVQYSGNVGDVFTVYDVSAGSATLGTLEVLPEPMTIALLGLGGLFLRRKK
ncbi:MAG: PEP-CTERM sorting domain-containing protein [Planctomycetes bacterium]|nr:PEP-CTERM sorting domain-containing protein [Planctomycetota bacterium]